MITAEWLLGVLNEALDEGVVCDNYRIIEKENGTFELQSSQRGTDSDYDGKSKLPFKTVKTLKSVKDCLKFAKYMNPGQHKPIQLKKLNGSQELVKA
jgi:hypothetical protein